jgi:hypothetical protein
MDMEDISKSYVKTAFVKEQNFCVPIGIGFGCITGYINEYIRNEVKYKFILFYINLTFIFYFSIAMKMNIRVSV